ncbi:MAG: dihydropteroate synthase [Chitinophagales bacterium]
MIADKTTYFYPNKTLRLGDQLLDLSTPRVMGILNITPDSFFDGGKYLSVDEALTHAENMVKEGVDIIDVGGMSSRPGATITDPDQELKRVIPVLTALKKHFPNIPFSIDTVHGKVALEAIFAGAALINDISNGSIDAHIKIVAAEQKVPYILMHMQGIPSNMQENPVYENVCDDVFNFFLTNCNALISSGIHQIIIDPGFGFGKSLENNYQLAANLQIFKKIGFPVMVGISRKSIVCKLLNINPEKALNGSTALHAVLLMKGADILRVHDVKEAVETIKIIKEIDHSMENNHMEL